MEWLNRLRGQIVGLDSAPLIYFVEANPTYSDRTDAFFEAMAQREFEVVTSTITLVEVLVYPLRANDEVLTQRYRQILYNQVNLSMVEITPVIAEAAARLRATYNLRTPDALQLATAIARGASFFLTNDERLP